MGRVRVIISCKKVIDKLFLKEKKRLTETALAAKVANFFQMVFGSGLIKDQIILVTDGQTNKFLFFDTIYGGMWIVSFS